MAHFGEGSVAVVGEAFHDDGGAGGAVSLVSDFLVVGAFQLSGAALGGALQVVAGHIGLAGAVQRQAQAGVRVRVAAADLGGDRHLADEARKNLALLGVHSLLAVADVRPFAVAGHGIRGFLSFRDSGKAEL